MSPRFQRRPERRSGASGGSDRPGDRWVKRDSERRPGARPAPRAAGGGRSWGEGKPEWRGNGGSGDGRPQRRSAGERAKPRFGERPAGQWRSSERSPERSTDRNSDRRYERSDERSSDRGRDRGERRFSAERRFSPDRRPMGRRDGRPFERREPRDERFDASRAPQGEAETLGTAPPSDLIWGRHPAEAALESGRPIHRIWCTPELRHTPRFLQLLREAKASGVLVEEVTWARLGQLTSGAVHQGIVLQSAAAETLDLSSLIEGCSQIGEPPLLMAIDGLTDPHNLGAIVRSAEALGAHGMVLPQRRCAGLTGSVAKVAAGALEHLPVARVVNLNRALDTLKQEGYRVVGLAAEGNVTLEEADLDGPLVVVTGSEGDGLSLLTRRSCDQLVRIPLRGSTPSLNASVATALLLYEIARRGWMSGLTGQAPAPRIQRPQLPSAALASEEPTSSEALTNEEMLTDTTIAAASGPATTEPAVAPSGDPASEPSAPESAADGETLLSSWDTPPLATTVEAATAGELQLDPWSGMPAQPSFAKDISL